MFTVLYHLQTLKWFGPAVFMLGSAPNFLMAHLMWRAASALLPTRVYQTGDDFMYSAYQRLVLFFFESMSGVKIYLYGDVERMISKKENIILICNHQSTVDWVVADMLAVRQGSIGHIRYILKDGLRYLPLYGFYFRQHSGIYVQRSGKFKQDRARQQLNQIIKTKIPFWMVVFPEGTRLNEGTLVKSKQFAEQQGLPSYDYLLVPRLKALQLCVEELRPECDAIYDITIGYSDTYHPDTGSRTIAPSLADFLHGFSRELHLHVQRVEMQHVPDGEDELRQWLHGRFASKDKMMADFYSEDASRRGRLGDSPQYAPLSLLHTFPAFLLFVAVNSAVLATPQGRSFYWKSTLLSTFACWAWMAISPTKPFPPPVTVRCERTLFPLSCLDTHPDQPTPSGALWSHKSNINQPSTPWGRQPTVDKACRAGDFEELSEYVLRRPRKA